jgi:hypothetical protein
LQGKPRQRHRLTSDSQAMSWRFLAWRGERTFARNIREMANGLAHQPRKLTASSFFLPS